MCSVSRASPSAKRPESQRGAASACWMSEAEVDHRDVGLQVDLRLAVGAHAAEHRPELLVLERERRDQRVQRHLAGLEAIGMLRVEREIGAAVLQHHAGLGGGDARAEHAVQAEDQRRGVALARPPRRRTPCRRRGCRRTAPCPRAARACGSIRLLRSSAYAFEMSRSIGTSAKRGSASQRSRSW